MGEMVGRAQGLHEGLADVGVEIGALPEDHALGAVLLDDLLEFVGDIIQGLVPGGPPPLAGAPGAGADHGILGPLVVVQQGQPGGAFGAQGPFDAGTWGLPSIHFTSSFSTSTRMGQRTRAHEADAVDFLCHIRTFLYVIATLCYFNIILYKI